MASVLIADSGSTKTDWCLMTPDGGKQLFKSSGMNPYLQSSTEAAEVLQKELNIQPEETKIDRVIFYGAGISDDNHEKQIKNVLSKHFKEAEIGVYSDLLAAAHATCGKDSGVVCILGTGSNSGYYNGTIIKHQNPSLGYIIGDEGSGTFLGKKVLQYYFYNTFDVDLSEAFRIKYGNDLGQILNKIYRESFGNRYLASFSVFLNEHRGHYMVENILEDAFIDFHQRHILKYRESWNYPIHFCGSIAFEFEDVLRSIQLQYGLETGNIIKYPMDGLCAFYK